MKFTFVVTTAISLHTDVEAESLEEAVRKAQRRSVMSLCHQCATGESRQEWVTSGELDGDPAGGELVEVYQDGDDGDDGQGEVFEQAKGLW